MSDKAESKIGFEFTVTYKLVVNLDGNSDEIVIPALTLKKHDLAKLLEEKKAHDEVKKTAKRWRNWLSKVFKKEYKSADSIRSFMQSKEYSELPQITQDKISNYLNAVLAQEKETLSNEVVLKGPLERSNSKMRPTSVYVVTPLSPPSENIEFISYKSKSRYITEKCMHCGKPVVPGSKSCYFCDS